MALHTQSIANWWLNLFGDFAWWFKNLCKGHFENDGKRVSYTCHSSGNNNFIIDHFQTSITVHCRTVQTSDTLRYLTQFKGTHVWQFGGMEGFSIGFSIDFYLHSSPAITIKKITSDWSMRKRGWIAGERKRKIFYSIEFQLNN